MQEKFVFLMHANDVVCELTQEDEEAGIPSKLEDYSENAFFRIYASDSLLGLKIMVPEARVNEAKTILNIDEKERDNFTFARSKRPLHKFAKLLIIIVLGIFFISFIVALYFNITEIVTTYILY